jgi:hypothetical protein
MQISLFIYLLPHQTEYSVYLKTPRSSERERENANKTQFCLLKSDLHLHQSSTATAIDFIIYITIPLSHLILILSQLVAL